MRLISLDPERRLENRASQKLRRIQRCRYRQVKSGKEMQTRGEGNIRIRQPARVKEQTA